MTGQLKHRLGGQCRTFVGFPPSGSWPGVFDCPTPAKAARGTRAWAQRRREPRTTDGAEGRPRTHFQSWAYPIWDLKGHLMGRKAGARVRADRRGKSNSYG